MVTEKIGKRRMIMKKQLLIISAFLALVGCSKEIEVSLSDEQATIEEQVQEIKVNLTINRSDGFAGTKATIKTAWVNGDVIFIFFKGIDAPKYLEMRYDGMGWTPTAKNALSASDLSNAADKKMTAIFLPYGSSATVASDGDNFVFSDLTYCGYFLQSERVSYTYDSELVGSLDLSAPSPNNDGDKYIHFDITGYNDGHSYSLSQDYVKPITFTSVSADGVVSHGEGAIGQSIIGYLDGENSIVSFSGLLDASVMGVSVDYRFSIDDVSASIMHTRDVGNKTISDSKFIGIGDISNPSVWTSAEYIDLGLSVKWAKCNLGASSPEQAGDYFAWGETETKNDYSWATYKWCNGTENSLTKYNTDPNRGSVDGKVDLDPEDDVAHVVLGGDWRLPTEADITELLDNKNCSWLFTTLNGVYGFVVTSIIKGYTDRSIFLPAAGYRLNTNYDSSVCGLYWSSTSRSDYSSKSWDLFFRQYGYYKDAFARYYGLPIRPVCP